MASLLQQLENNEAVLLMYLADELPADDMTEVEQMLSVDANLRQELETIREANQMAEAALAELDRLNRPLVSRDAVLRRASQAMKQWQVERTARPVVLVVPQRLRFTWWSYPVAAAASILIALLVWWGNKDASLQEKTTEIVLTDTIPPAARSLLSVESVMAQWSDDAAAVDSQVAGITKLDDSSIFLSGNDIQQ